MRPFVLLLGLSACAAPPAKAPIDIREDEGPVVAIAAERSTAELQRKDARGNWEPVCLAPCFKRIDASYRYRIGGDSILPSEPFRLPRSADWIDVKTRTAAKGQSLL